MKTQIPSRLLLLTLLLVLTLTKANAIVISTFGSSVAGDMTGSWATGYTAGTSTVDATVGAGNGIQDFDTSFASIIGTTSFRLTASVSGVNPATSFSITVFDQEGDTAVGTFNWSSFGSSLTSVDAIISYSGSFDSSPLGWELATGGIGQSINVQFSQLDAVPEPSTYVLIGLGLGALVLLRRKAKKA